MAINSVLGHWLQNSIGNETQADAHFAQRTEATEWTSLTSANKQKVLQQATLDLINAIPLGGAPMFYYNLDDDGTILVDETAPPFSQKFDSALSVPKSKWETGKRHLYETSTADSGDTTTLVDASLADKYQDDVWIYGSILLTARDPRVMVEITDFDSATGTFTFAAIGSAVSSTDTYVAVYPAPADIYRGVFEQALYIAGGNYDQRENLINQGVASISSPGNNEQYQVGGQRTQGTHICPKAEEAWRPYRARPRIG